MTHHRDIDRLTDPPSADYNKHCSERMHAPLAQLVEQLTLNQWVPGSSP
jgi:hypothetical protein